MILLSCSFFINLTLLLDIIGNARAVGTIATDLQHHEVRTKEEPSSCARRPEVLRFHGQQQAEVPQLLLR